ncbi:MAG: hypothetical protein LBL19_04645 [Spirochaetaceae bacterium]|jgi:hypothetical protein|nr:hypothetical protein [Spirochaetaceae bacterium]
MFFILEAPELNEKDLCLEKEEFAGIHLFRPDVIDYDELVFDSIHRTVRAYVERLYDYD